MVLTPDQKRRIAELDSQAPAEEEKKEPEGPPIGGRLKGIWLRFRTAPWRPVALKILVIALVIGIAGFYITEYRIHKINFRKVFSSGPGNPIDRLILALKEQKKKVEMLEQAQAQFLVGDYAESLATAAAIAKMDGKDERAQNIIDLAADAAVQRASRELDLGEIEAALADARLALKYRPEHQEAYQLSLRIGDRLFREARTHYSKAEYPQLIKKTKEVIKINPSDMGASNLLMRTNSELLAQAEQLLFTKRYFDALEKVRLSLLIDASNPTALRLLSHISDYVETPDIKLRGITKIGNVPYAIVKIPNSNEPRYVKKGETIRNFKLIDIDPDEKTAKFLQIYSKAEFTIELSKPE